MSTRKSTATPTIATTSVSAIAATIKPDNVAPKGTSSTTVVNASGEEKTNMGLSMSTAGGDQSDNDSPTSSKDATKSDIKQAGNEPKRITRNSPLLLASPTIGSGNRKEQRANDGVDSELTNSEGEDGFSTSRRPAQIRGRKSLKEAKDNTDKDKIKSAENTEPEKSDKTSKETDSNESKETKHCKESETEVSAVSAPSTGDSVSLPSVDNNPNATNTLTTTVTMNRLTRKTVAQELAANTRVTRNRQTSTNRPETPPSTSTQTAASTRTRRSNAGKKMPLPMVESVTKRRRPDEETSSEVTGSKIIKVEIKDDTEMTEDELPPPAATNQSYTDNDIKIKQELIESDESATEAITSASNVTRSRSRWSVRKSQQANLQSSPSTRATRHSKNASPSPSPTTSSTSSASGGGPTESKRRRYAPSNTLTRSSSMSLLKTTTTSVSANGAQLHVPDEDSKDSMASSSVDELLLIDVKLEKMSSDLLGETHLELEVDDKNTLSATSGISEPLKVDTEPSAKGADVPKLSSADNKTINVEASTSLAVPDSRITQILESSEKAASLSPEMVSEGVSEISVKQFYKKPEFLENNLGIEEDPKLGEIVQKVTIEKENSDVDISDNCKVSVGKTETPTEEHPKREPVDLIFSDDDNLKEGDLHMDESTEEKKVSMSDDTNSLDNGSFSPLIVEEDEEFEAVVENNIEAVTAVEDDNTSKADAVTEKEDTDLLEDDITMEESETISMDNNPSINEEITENTRDELQDEIEEIDHYVESTVKNNEEKTKTECDRNEAKLKVDMKVDEMMGADVKLIEDERAIKSDSVVQDQGIITENSEKKPKMMEELPKSTQTIEKNKANKSTPDVKITASLENMEDDELVNKIDAELKRFGDWEKERDKDKDAVNMANDVGEKKSMTIADDARNIQPEEEVKEHKVKGEISNKIDQVKSKLEIIESEMVFAESDPTKKDIGISDDKDVLFPSTTVSKCHGNVLINTKKSDIIKLEDIEETLRQKEQHLQNLGLLTHKAAEKRRQEYIQSSAAAVEASRTQQHQNQQNNGSSKRNGKTTNAAIPQEYTGTLKTVIKINRNCNGGHTSTTGNTTSSGRKGSSTSSALNNQHSTAISGSTVVATSAKEAANGSGNTMRRQSLKITFQKGRGRGLGHNDRATDQHNQGEDSYYTIQNENEEAQKAGNTGTSTDHLNTQTHGRKSYNRSNTTSHSTNSATIDFSDSESHEVTHYTTLSASNKILIPEKASSFKFHPDRLCDDQCFYCGGKFGLYDTPCHVGQIKSIERQQKILANEEKLTVDSCLCEACFRHVDRRANVPSYRKRLSASGHLESNTGTGESADGSVEGEEDTEPHKCVVPDCANPAVHSLRRKCIKKSVKKFLHSFGTPPSPCVWLCQAHYATVMQCSGCVLCKRRLGKNHMYHITSDTDRLEKALSEMGIPVQLGIGTAVCKLCRYFANLLMKPRDGNKSQKEKFLKSYRKRLMQFHNIHNDSNEVSEADEDDGGATSSTVLEQNTNNNKIVQTLNRSETKSIENNTPSKELPSPAGSTGSSVECLGETTTLSITNSQDSFIGSEKHKKNQSAQQVVLDNNVLVDYDAPMLQSSDSNLSSAPMSPTNDAVSGKQQMSKLKAILQSNSNNSISNGANQSKSASSNSSTADISTVLRANPNISMRELFPGEEDLGLNFKAPFGSSNSQRTPEGWTRVQTFLQYDEPTRGLWEDLQKPYGNQSSFLRHLILLEKYFRNGDLVLSSNASSNASVYTQTVRQRLTSYDQGHCGGLISAKPFAQIEKKNSSEIPTVEINEDDDEESPTKSITNEMQSEIDYSSEEAKSRHNKRSRSISVDKLTKQLSTNAVTIIARPKQQQILDPSPQKSLLKDKPVEVSNNAHNAAPTSSATLTSLCGSSASINSNVMSNSRSILKTNLLGINKSVEILPISSSNVANSSSNVSLVAGKNHNITTETKQQKILEVANKLLGNQLEAVAAAEAQSKTNATSLPTSPPELVSLQRRSLGTVGNSVSNSATTAATTSSLTTSLINNKRAQVMPKGSGSSGNVSTHRSSAPPNVVILPESLTPQERQQSKSWRPTLMPVEENQHLLSKGGPLYQTADGRRLPALVQVQSGGKPFLISIFDYNRMCILRREKLLRDQMLKVGKNRHDTKQHQQPQHQHQHQQHQQQQQQHLQKGINISTASLQNVNKNINKQQQQQQQQQTAQQQLLQLQLMQFQKQQQQAAMKAGRYQHIAPKPPASSHSGSSSASSSITTTSSTLAGNSANSANAFPGTMMPLLANTLPGASVIGKTGGIGNSSWLWNNFPDANLLLNGNLAQTTPKLPQLLHKTPILNASNTPATITSSQQQQQMLIDNTLMSKIPKSLTVIPQHKLMNAAAVAAANNSVANMSHKE